MPDSTPSKITPLPLTMSNNIHGPGILHVRSRISSPLLSESTFLHWYDADHIPEVISTSGIETAFRYVDTNKSTPEDAHKPFLAVYPMQDMGFTLSEEFKAINVHSDILPGSGVVYDLADMDVSYLGLKGTTKKEQDSNGPAKFIVTCGMRLDASIPADRITLFYKQQTLGLSRVPGYSRSLTFELQYARTNAQSRKLKGLLGGEEKCIEPSSWVVMHEFEGRPDNDMVKGLKEQLATLEESVGLVEGEVLVWGLERAFGTGKMFD